MSTQLPLIVGELYTRQDIAIQYGGSRQGGIIASTKSDSVFIFTDRAEGNQFGYVYDGFGENGSVLHYTGAGQDGDQPESHANSPVLTHAEKGRTVHAFVADGFVAGTQTKRQRYIGEFFLDPARPFERMPAPDKNGALRTVIVFRLLPVAPVPDNVIQTVGTSDITDRARSMEVPTEINSTHFFETTDRASSRGIRRESQLVDDFIASQQGHEFKRWAIRIPQERSPLLTDVYDKTDRVLYEAKGLTGRSTLRMAVGQLYDYRRHVDVEGLRCSVLLPERPSADLRDFIGDAGLGLVFRDGESFRFENYLTPARG